MLCYRVVWAKSNRCRDWEKVVISNEMFIWLAGGRVCVWCKGDSKPVKPSTKHSPKLHVWERFQHVGRFLSKDLRKISPDDFTAAFYMNVLLEDSWRRKGYRIHRMDWPACSPDLTLCIPYTQGRQEGGAGGAKYPGPGKA